MAKRKFFDDGAVVFTRREHTQIHIVSRESRSPYYTVEYKYNREILRGKFHHDDLITYRELSKLCSFRELSTL